MTNVASYGLMVDLKAHLQNVMIDNVPSEYESTLTYTDKNGASQVLKPSLIQIGRLQDDPTALADSSALPSAHIAIHEGDPDDLGDGWAHSIAVRDATDRQITNLDFRLYPREIGGGEMWWRRYKVEFVSYFLYSDQSQEEAAKLGNLFLAFLELYCASKTQANVNGWDVCKSYAINETSLQSEIAKSVAIERGGPEDDYIWQGFIWLQVLTERGGL